MVCKIKNCKSKNAAQFLSGIFCFKNLFSNQNHFLPNGKCFHFLAVQLCAIIKKINIMDKRNSKPKGLLKGKLITLIIGLLFSSITMFAQTTKSAIVGTWLNQDKAAKIEIYEQGGKLFGKIVWLKEPNENGKPKMDNKNPDKARHSDPIIGSVMLKNFVFNGKSTWEDGTIYDARSGKTYSSYMTLQADKTLKVRGYLGISLFGQTNIWTRVN
jgi:uncharacterized protein (DUF2147 family)